MSDIDAIIGRLDRISLAAQLRDLVSAATEAAREECGDCQFWMKSSLCPREKNVNGWNRGPSAKASPCGKYSEVARKSTLVERRRKAASEFAISNGLADPFAAARADRARADA